MLPNNLITHFILSGLIGSIYGYLLCWLTWTLTDMDLSWHKVRHLTKELEVLTEELTGRNKRMDELLNALSHRTRKHTNGWETKGDKPPLSYPLNPFWVDGQAYTPGGETRLPEGVNPNAPPVKAERHPCFYF